MHSTQTHSPYSFVIRVCICVCVHVYTYVYVYICAQPLLLLTLLHLLIGCIMSLSHLVLLCEQ